jgi:hypothetical protein
MKIVVSAFRERRNFYLRLQVGHPVLAVILLQLQFSFSVLMKVINIILHYNLSTKTASGIMSRTNIRDLPVMRSL